MSTNKQSLKELYSKVERQAHSLRGNPREYQVITGLCPVNVIELHAQKILALLDELDKWQQESSTWKSVAEKQLAIATEMEAKLQAAESRIAELEAREIEVKQFSEFQICHYGATEDYAKGYIDCQKNYNKALGAAGILVSLEKTAEQDHAPHCSAYTDKGK